MTVALVISVTYTVDWTEELPPVTGETSVEDGTLLAGADSVGPAGEEGALTAGEDGTAPAGEDGALLAGADPVGAGTSTVVEIVLRAVNSVVITLGVLRTIVDPEVVKVWPTGQVVTVELVISVT